MSAISKIQWTDRTWNPVRGCAIVSPGCVNCYAMKQAHRFSGPGRAYEGLTKQTKAGPQWTGKIRTVESALLEPLSWRKPQRVFVNSMSDLFHGGVPDEFIDRAFAAMALAPQHTFQILTKRPERMRRYFEQLEIDWTQRWDAARRPLYAALRAKGDARFEQVGILLAHTLMPLPNVWLGVSCEDQQRADERIPLLLQTPAAIRFISAEPLLGPIDLANVPLPQIHDQRGRLVSGPILDWAIAGGESGPNARPCDVGWIRSIVQQCQSASVPVFVKQLGAKPFQACPLCGRSLGNCLGGLVDECGPAHARLAREVFQLDRKGDHPAGWPEDLRVRQFPDTSAVPA